MEEKTIKAIVIGAGSRGTTYASKMKALGNKYKVVAVAEPIESRRNAMRDAHGISEDMCFDDYHPLLECGKIADLAIIATMDQMHFEPSIMALNLGYDLLLEKPVSNDPNECVEIARVAKEKNAKVLVCHVLRYSDMFVTLKNLIDNGTLGDIISITHEECVGIVHQSHSFVRGNWGNSDTSSPMLLQKSCHDLDILQWLIGKKCKKIQSFGHLSYFKKENAPKGSPEYCIEGCPVGNSCPFNAVKLYLDDKNNSWFRTTCSHHANPTDEIITKAISTTQYGKCVYKCDNNVVDHQTVNILFEDDITVTFNMNAFNKGGRFIHIMGTKGEVRAASDNKSPITLYNYETKETTEVPIYSADGINGGHGGGDKGIIATLYEYLTDTYSGPELSTADISAKNHLIVFAAEKSRKENTVVDFDEFIKDYDI